MPSYLITVKAPLKDCKLIFDFLCSYYHLNVIEHVFTVKPYSHAHFVVSSKLWLDYKRIHKLVTQLKLSRKPYINLKLLQTYKDIRKAVEYVRLHEGVSDMNIEERVERLEKIVLAMAKKLGVEEEQTEEQKTQQSNSFKIGKATIRLKDSKYNDGKLLVIETAKTTAFINASESQLRAFAEWLLAQLGQTKDSMRGKSKKNNSSKKIKTVKGFKKAIEE